MKILVAGDFCPDINLMGEDLMIDFVLCLHESLPVGGLEPAVHPQIERKIRQLIEIDQRWLFFHIE